MSSVGQQPPAITSLTNGGLFLEGPAGTGKTTAGVHHLRALLESGVPGRRILVVAPQRSLGTPFADEVQKRGHCGTDVDMVTIGGLARRTIRLFWPLVADHAGFDPSQPPVFLTLETAQYFMAKVVQPLQEEGAFAGLSIASDRLYSQVIDNLNKAAVVGFPHTDIASRLKKAWIGETERLGAYEDAQRAAETFRKGCLKHNLLDFSLQLDVFFQHIWTTPTCKEHLTKRFRHLIAENVEEDVPATHRVLAEWIPEADSALAIYDQDAGYRQFLGADPASARRLVAHCDHHEMYSASTGNQPLRGFGRDVSDFLGYETEGDVSDIGGAEDHLEISHERYYPAMIRGVVERVTRLVHEKNVAPKDIAVLPPFLSDSLRFELGAALEERDVPYYARKPSRPLNQEDGAQALLVLAILAHPEWAETPQKQDVAFALRRAIADLDPVRSRLLVDAVFDPAREDIRLRSFNRIPPDLQERITYKVGEHYQTLRGWLISYEQESCQPLDHFLSRLYGEVLSQQGFGYHEDTEAATIADNLIESTRKFRDVLEHTSSLDDTAIGHLYTGLVREGVAAAQYVRDWRDRSEEAVLLAPAYTFLMRNRPAAYQFLLDVGSRSWYDRINQPLTHPHVLHQSWEGGEWTDANEQETERRALSRLALGLSRRCTQKIHLGICTEGETGNEKRGLFLKALQRVVAKGKQSA